MTNSEGLKMHSRTIFMAAPTLLATMMAAHAGAEAGNADAELGAAQGGVLHRDPLRGMCGEGGQG